MSGTGRKGKASQFPNSLVYHWKVDVSPGGSGHSATASQAAMSAAATKATRRLSLPSGAPATAFQDCMHKWRFDQKTNSFIDESGAAGGSPSAASAQMTLGAPSGLSSGRSRAASPSPTPTASQRKRTSPSPTPSSAMGGVGGHYMPASSGRDPSGSSRSASGPTASRLPPRRQHTMTALGAYVHNRRSEASGCSCAANPCSDRLCSCGCGTCYRSMLTRPGHSSPFDDGDDSDSQSSSRGGSSKSVSSPNVFSWHGSKTQSTFPMYNRMKPQPPAPATVVSSTSPMKSMRGPPHPSSSSASSSSSSQSSSSSYFAEPAPSRQQLPSFSTLQRDVERSSPPLAAMQQSTKSFRQPGRLESMGSAFRSEASFFSNRTPTIPAFQTLPHPKTLVQRGASLTDMNAMRSSGSSRPHPLSFQESDSDSGSDSDSDSSGSRSGSDSGSNSGSGSDNSSYSSDEDSHCLDD